METTFLDKALEDRYSESEIAEIFTDALDKTIYNMIVQDFIERTGVDINTIISRAKTVMLNDFHEAAQKKNITISEELATKFENALTTGASQVKSNLS